MYYVLDELYITFNYAHLYSSKQKTLADRLNEDRGDVDATRRRSKYYGEDIQTG